MKLTIGATGIKQAIQAIKSDAQKKRELIKREVQIAAVHIEGEAKTLVPVDTGRLRASIDSSYPQEYSAVVGTDVEYAEDIENGLSKQAPNGFLFPAAESYRATFIRNIKNILQQ